MDEQRLREIIREEVRAAMPCTCQYGNDGDNFTPPWYMSVRTCLRHNHLYDEAATPESIAW